MDNNPNNNPYHRIQNYLLYSHNPLSTFVEHSFSGEHPNLNHQHNLDVNNHPSLSSPNYNLVGLNNHPFHNPNLDPNYHLYPTAFGHPPSSLHPSDVPSSSRRDTFTVPSPVVLPAIVVSPSEEVPSLKVHVHTDTHYHAGPYLTVKRYQSGDEWSGLGYTMSKFPPGYYQRTKDGKNYREIEAKEVLRAIISVPDLCILGSLDETYHYHALYAIYNGNYERVSKPPVGNWAELMLDEEKNHLREGMQLRPSRIKRRRN